LYETQQFVLACVAIKEPLGSPNDSRPLSPLENMLCIRLSWYTAHPIFF
jgi:hypothetical protein